MCDVLNLPKSTYYYHADESDKREKKAEDKELSREIVRIFKESRNNYGTRKIKKELAKLPESKQVSRRRIGRLMNEMGLVSNYTSLEQLALKLNDYVHWFNNIRIHGTLDYLTPVEFKQKTL